MDTEKDQPKGQKILVSACLLGLPTRYDGASKERPEIRKLAQHNTLIPVCPEQLGGLPTPRPPAEITEGDGKDVLDGGTDVINDQDNDVTENYVRGAQCALEIASLVDADLALLKEGSPACGVTRIKRNDSDVQGMGVAAALLARDGLKVRGVE